MIKRRLKKSVSTEEEKEADNKSEGKRRASEIMTEETVETGTVRIHVFDIIMKKSAPQNTCIVLY